MAASLPTRWARSSAASDWDTHGRRFFVARAVAVAPIWQPHRRRSSASLAGVGVRPAVAGRLGALGGTMGTPLDTPARRPPGVAGGVRPPPPLPPRVWYLCGRGAHAVWRAARFHRRSAVVTATCSVGREAPLRGDAANPGVPGLPQRRAASVWFVFLFYLSPGGRRAVDFLSRRDCSLPPAIKCRGLFVEGTSGGHEGRMRSKGLVSYGVWLRGLGA